VTAEAIGALHEAMCEAMVAGNLAELDSVLAENFTLTRMTGYVQSRSGWLDAMESGEMQYHRMETVDDTVARRIQTRLDVEEQRLTGIESVD
jgi:hypothetical protein